MDFWDNVSFTASSWWQSAKDWATGSGPNQSSCDPDKNGGKVYAACPDPNAPPEPMASMPEKNVSEPIPTVPKSSMPATAPRKASEESAYQQQQANQKKIEACESKAAEARGFCKSSEGVGPAQGLPRASNTPGIGSYTAPGMMGTPPQVDPIR